MLTQLIFTTIKVSDVLQFTLQSCTPFLVWEAVYFLLYSYQELSPLVQSSAIMGLVGGTLSDLTMHPNKVNRQINMLSFVSFIYAEQRKYYHLSLNI
jgi:hypothetical protein